MWAGGEGEGEGEARADPRATGRQSVPARQADPGVSSVRETRAGSAARAGGVRGSMLTYPAPPGRERPRRRSPRGCRGGLSPSPGKRSQDGDLDLGGELDGVADAAVPTVRDRPPDRALRCALLVQVDVDIPPQPGSDPAKRGRNRAPWVSGMEAKRHWCISGPGAWYGPIRRYRVGWAHVRPTHEAPRVQVLPRGERLDRRARAQRVAGSGSELDEGAYRST